MAENNQQGGWRKYFRVASVGGELSPISGQNQFGLPGFNRQTGGGAGMATGNDFAFRNYASRLPEVYSGHPNRIERYNQYENMDCDSEVNACLDIISEFSTQLNDDNQTPFEIKFKEDPTKHELEIVQKQLQQWTKINKLDQRIFKLFRNTIKYGDQLFVRDPETFELYWVDMVKVSRIIVNESEGKRPEQYIIRDINPNFQNMSISQKTTQDYYVSRATGSVGQTNYTYPNGGAGAGAGGGTGNARFTQAMNETCIDARHVVHLSLNEGLDYFWPFGQSILENIFKVYKQKELLEDSVLIYRVARAPERRVFKIDVGNMPSHLAMQFVERVKNEMHQRRIPTVTGGGCFDMNTRVPLLDGRTLTLTELAKEYKIGKINWAYSCNPATGVMVPGQITWAGITKKNTQVIRLTLDNGETIVCTPEHKFPIWGRGKVEAKDIVSNEDSLISFNTRLWSINDKKDNNEKDPQYQQVFCHDSKEWKFVHRSVANFMKNLGMHQELVWEGSTRLDAKKGVIHHADFDKYNNNPDNLAFMSGYDHFMLHATQTAKFRATLTEEAKEAIEDKKRETIANWPQWKKDQRAKVSSDTFANYWEELKKDEQKFQERKEILTSNFAEQQKKPFPNQAFAWCDGMYEIVCDKMKLDLSQEELIRSLNEDAEFMTLYRYLNKPLDGHAVKFDTENLTGWTLRKILKACGYESWRAFMEANGQKTKRHGRRISFTPHLWSLVIDEVKNNGSRLQTVVTNLNQNKKFTSLYAKENVNVKGNANPNKFTGQTLKTCVSNAGYKNWTDFVQKIPQFNHKVISSEWLEQTQDVGTLTIDGTEELHDFHTFAIEQGVYTFNSNMMDASYNPLSINEDYFFPQTAEGRGSSVDTLQGGQNLGEIDDLKYFNNKMARGLRVPSSYLPTGPDDSSVAMNDGKVGTALIQEYRFNQYCIRLQNLIMQKLDDEFKMFLRWRGFSIDAGMFNLKFTPPQNFASYRQSELDTTRITAFAQLEPLPYMSKRFLMERFLGLTLEEIQRNEELWKEEREEPDTNGAKGSDLRGVGVTPGGITGDIDAGAAFGAEMGGAEGAPPADIGGGAPDLGGAAPPPAPPPT